MRRIMAPSGPSEAYADWVSGLLSGLRENSGILVPAVVSDPSDGHIVHLDGLNLSRAWMMRNIVARLPEDHYLAQLLAPAAEAHREAGLKSVIDPHYAGGHWLGSFATYLETARGL